MIPTFEQLADWAEAELRAARYQLRGRAELVKERAWGMVLRLPTEAGNFYAKANCDGLAAEAALYDLLRTRAPEHIVSVVATRPVEGWMLLADGGRVLGDDPYTPTQWARALTEYAALQRHLEPDVDAMLACGILDARPTALLARWEELLEHPGLKHGERNGISQAEADALRRLTPRVAKWGESLTTSVVAMTIQHDDVHPRNVFAADGRIFDWGDACIAHPFASLLTALQFVRPQVEGKQSPESVTLLHSPDGEVAGVIKAYLTAWLELASLEQLRREAAVAIQLAPIGRALNWARIPGAGGEFEPPAMAGWMRRMLASAECSDI